MVAAILVLQIRDDSWFSVASFLPSDEQSSCIEINDQNFFAARGKIAIWGLGPLQPKKIKVV